MYCLIAAALFIGILSMLVATSHLSWRPRARSERGRDEPTVPN